MAGMKGVIFGLIAAGVSFLASEATEKGLWALDGKLHPQEESEGEEGEKTEEITET